MLPPDITSGTPSLVATSVRPETRDALMESDMPTISVVIPAFNEAKNLPYVFASLPKDIFEVILVDGHSTDNTVAVARSLYPSVRVIYQTRRGQGKALACGFAACRGDI